MRKTVVFVALAITLFSKSFAAAPATSCPSGYIAVTKNNTTVALSCPSGYVDAGTAVSCLTSISADECVMFAPPGVTYTDATGSYEYTDACPLE